MYVDKTRLIAKKKKKRKMKWETFIWLDSKGIYSEPLKKKKIDHQLGKLSDNLLLNWDNEN